MYPSEEEIKDRLNTLDNMLITFLHEKETLNTHIARIEEEKKILNDLNNLRGGVKKMKKNNDEEHWNNDLQGMFEIVDLGMRQMLRRKKISVVTYNKWCKDIELSSQGKLTEEHNNKELKFSREFDGGKKFADAYEKSIRIKQGLKKCQKKD